MLMSLPADDGSVLAHSIFRKRRTLQPWRDQVYPAVNAKGPVGVPCGDTAGIISSAGWDGIRGGVISATAASMSAFVNARLALRWHEWDGHG